MGLPVPGACGGSVHQGPHGRHVPVREEAASHAWPGDRTGAVPGGLSGPASGLRHTAPLRPAWLRPETRCPGLTRGAGGASPPAPGSVPANLGRFTGKGKASRGSAPR